MYSLFVCSYVSHNFGFLLLFYILYCVSEIISHMQTIHEKKTIFQRVETSSFTIFQLLSLVLFSS